MFTLKTLLQEPGWMMKETPGMLSTGEAAQTFSTSLEEIQNNVTQSITYHEWRQQPDDHDPTPHKIVKRAPQYSQTKRLKPESLRNRPNGKQ